MGIKAWVAESRRSLDFVRAAVRDEPDALFSIGDYYYRRGNKGQAERWYRTAANAGEGNHAGAAFNLAALLNQRGEEDEAEQWCRKAAERGQTEAALHVGFLHKQRGEIDTAREWWLRAAESGNATAMFNLGTIAADDEPKRGTAERSKPVMPTR